MAIGKKAATKVIDILWNEFGGNLGKPGCEKICLLGIFERLEKLELKGSPGETMRILREEVEKRV